MLRTEQVTGPEMFDSLRERWRSLARDACATPFQTWEWQSVWWKHYGGFSEPRAVTVYEGDDLVGLFPMIRTRAPWRVLRPMGIGPSDYLHPVARPGYEDRVAREVAETLAASTGVDLIDLHQLRETQPLAGIASGVRFDQATCLVLDLPETYDAYLATLGKSLRYDVRKLDKTMFKEGRATIEVCGAADVDRGLGILFDLHKARWKERHLPGAFLGKTVSFHREWAPLAAKNGWLNLGILHVDKQPIGAIYAMSSATSVFYYQAGFDPAHGSVSPGTLLVASTIRRAIDEGRRHFDFMRGDEGYKRRWKPQHELKNVRLVSPVRSPLGAIGAGWNRFGFRVEKRIRERLEGRGLL